MWPTWNAVTFSQKWYLLISLHLHALKLLGHYKANIKHWGIQSSHFPCHFGFGPRCAGCITIGVLTFIGCCGVLTFPARLQGLALPLLADLSCNQCHCPLPLPSARQAVSGPLPVTARCLCWLESSHTPPGIFSVYWDVTWRNSNSHLQQSRSASHFFCSNLFLSCSSVPLFLGKYFSSFFALWWLSDIYCGRLTQPVATHTQTHSIY